jgi:hypothetical protein
MTILDPHGRDTAALAEQWLVHAMYGWLRHQRVAIAMRCAGWGESQVRTLYRNLSVLVASNKLPPVKEFRDAALKMLQNRNVRKAICRAVMQDQHEDHERARDKWVEETHHWLMSQEPDIAGPKPVKPPDERLGKFEVMRSLQAERERLEGLLE